jgi:hypothetical protein
MTVNRNSGSAVQIPVASLAGLWTDPNNAYPVTLRTVGNASTNLAPVINNSGTIFYTNTNNVNDLIFYSIVDSHGLVGFGAINVVPTGRATPVLTWTNPADIVYGTALSSSQLTASANVAGTFTYNPTNGTVLNAGTNVLSATFTPADTGSYSSASLSTLLVVRPAAPVVTWTNPADILYGTALGSSQLNAGANRPGTFVYTPPAGTVLEPGSNQLLSVSFSPADSTNYTTAHASADLNVLKVAPAITWAAPAGIVFGTPLDSNQLNASANVSGTFVYNPPAGSVLGGGNQTLTLAFTPDDSAHYTTVTASNLLTVAKAGTLGALASSTDVSLPHLPVVFTFTSSAVAPGIGSPTGNVQFKFHGTNAPYLVSLSGGAVSYTNSNLAHGSNTVVAEYAGDANFLGATNVLALPVLINTPPTNGNYVLATFENTAATITASKLAIGVADPDGDPLTLVFVSTTSTNGATITSNGTSYTYMPVTNFFGADSFTYAVHDPYSAIIATNTVMVTVRSSGTAPTLTIQSVTPPTGTNTSAIVYGSGRPLATYNVQRSTNASVYYTIGSTNALANGLIIFIDTNPPPSSAFYRFTKP